MGRLNEFLDQFQQPIGDRATESPKAKVDITEDGDRSPGKVNMPCAHEDEVPRCDTDNFPQNDEFVSEHQAKQAEFCRLLWEGISEKIKAVLSEYRPDYPPAMDGDPDLVSEDIRLRKIIWEELQNPRVNFREFSRLVYRWRELHLNSFLPKIEFVDIPLWGRSETKGKGSDVDGTN